ncbi:lipid droplet assembly factor 1-like isoform X2 [Brachyistius frenatus]|uniref:lipid droplet assembly factor 1-like isoform X2 n=1 Tax=Brachyistius frenatus TaxID=100188 RepID=UPI0037E9AE90
MCAEMQNSSSNNGVIGYQQLRGRWTTLLNRLNDDPKVALVMNSRLGQYLSRHPSLALTALVFGAMAALPTGLFLSFALVTMTMSVVGFVFFEVFLLFVGGVTLLSVLSGIGFFSVLVSGIIYASYITIINPLYRNYPHLIKGPIQGKESESEPSEQKEMQ